MNKLATLQAQFAVECIDLEAASGIEGASWERFQLVLLNDESKLSIWRKSRQVAFSFTSALEALLDAILIGRGSIFVSINLDEAKEKIRYARRIYESITGVRVPHLVRDNELSLEFPNGVRLESLPGKAPRGRGRRNVYLDEYAHVARDRQVYQGALPVISKGGGRLRIGSSTMGASGMFWEIDTESMQQYPGYRRVFVPWWEVRSFCHDIKRARVEAPAMHTEARVDQFGTEIIQMIFANMPIEDFQQEYEAVYVDEAHSWISYAEIKANQDPGLDCAMIECRDGEVQRAIEAIADLATKTRTGAAEKALGVGVDIGRKRNTTEIYIGGQTTTDTYPLRLAISLDNTPFVQQEDLMRHIMKSLPVVQMLIDRNGLGMQLAENLSAEFPVKVVGVDFTAPSKTLWSTDAKMLCQKVKTPIPQDRDLAYQIHSIKRRITGSKNLVFDTETNEKHHADKYWAWALMLSSLRGRMESDQFVATGGVLLNWR